MVTDSPLPTVQRMFEAFGNRDLDRVLEIVHPDSR
jgi:ketosteroid isomerase-like protein